MSSNRLTAANWRGVPPTLVVATLKIMRVLWLCVASAFAALPAATVDTNPLIGWLFFLWTFPGSGVWWLYIYDVFRNYMSDATVQLVGRIFIVACAYVFWFVLVPVIWRRTLKKRHEADVTRVRSGR